MGAAGKGATHMSQKITMPKSVKPSAFDAELLKMDLGIQTNLPATEIIRVNGAPLAQPAIRANLQAWLDASKAVDDAKEKYHAAVEARRTLAVPTRTFFKALKESLRAFFGRESPLLASFGITKDLAHTATAKEKLVAAAKREQTRKVRGTKGRKQRAAMKVVGDPAVHISSTGEVEVSAPPLNLPPAGSDGAIPTGGAGAA